MVQGDKEPELEQLTVMQRLKRLCQGHPSVDCVRGQQWTPEPTAAPAWKAGQDHLLIAGLLDLQRPSDLVVLGE